MIVSCGKASLPQQVGLAFRELAQSFGRTAQEVGRR